MSILTAKISGQLFLIIIFSYIVLDVLRIMFFLPYRNKLMRWLMFRFSPHYRQAKKVFNELLCLQSECMQGSISISQGYYKFFEHLQCDKRFKGIEYDKPKSIDDLLQGSLSYLEYEQFVYFSGNGKNLHKIRIVFDLQEEINLLFIELFYHEEEGHLSFYCELEKKKFRPGPGNRRRRKRSPVSSPSYA
jgi:hypothetical protein